MPRIRAAWPETKIVVLSGLAGQQSLEQSLGVNAVVLKGTGLDQIVGLLKAARSRSIKSRSIKQTPR